MKLKIFVGMLLPMFIFAYSGKSAELTTDKSTVKYMRMGGQGKMHFVHVESSSSINRNSYREIAKKYVEMNAFVL